MKAFKNGIHARYPHARPTLPEDRKASLKKYFVEFLVSANVGLEDTVKYGVIPSDSVL